MSAVLLYITCENKLQAESIARALLEQRLIACANILPGATSLYHWEGTLTQAEECILTAKTTEALAAEAIEKTKALHSYECPCIVTLTITGGHKPFLEWIEAQTR